MSDCRMMIWYFYLPRKSMRPLWHFILSCQRKATNINFLAHKKSKLVHAAARVLARNIKGGRIEARRPILHLLYTVFSNFVSSVQCEPSRKVNDWHTHPCPAAAFERGKWIFQVLLWQSAVIRNCCQVQSRLPIFYSGKFGFEKKAFS